jgi:uncharacterized lipoprotein YbaY
MSKRPFPAFAALAALFLAGCASLDVNREVELNRVITGTVNVGQSFPAGSEVTVRALEMPGGRAPAAASAPVERVPAVATERILGEFTVTLAAPAADGLPFRLSLGADDATLRRGILLEGRVLYGGSLRFRTVNAHAVTAQNVNLPQRVVLQPAGP